MITAIMIDSREPEWIQKLQFGGIPTVVTKLDHGDLMAATDDGQMILVERKTPEDLLNTLQAGRLFPQLSDMLDLTRWSYLVITGELLRGPQGNVVTGDRGNTGWSWTAVQGALLTVQEMGIFILYAGGDADFEPCILRLGARDRRPDLILEPPKFTRILSAQEAIIASLPGIGIERLQAVMEYCGTAAWALVALTDDSTQIPGIGEGVKRKIRATLKLEDQQFAIISNDQDAAQLTIAKLGAQ